MAGLSRTAVSMKANVKTFLLMALVQFVAYANLTVNFRAISAGMIPVAMATDAAAAAISYFIVRRIVRSESPWTLAGMMVGGSLAAWFGIWLTEHWK